MSDPIEVKVGGDTLDPLMHDGPRVRHAVKSFAEAMEAKLKTNDAEKGKSGWKDMTPHELLDCIHDEVSWLYDAFECNSLEGMMDECVDVANFAMMIFDKLSGEAVKLLDTA